jgi:NADH-quinone oxidoreductase subunit K
MIEGGIIIGVILFLIGGIGFFVRKNFIILLMCIEIMLAGANLVMVSFSKSRMSFEGDITVLFVIAVAAAEAGVGLAIAVHMRRSRDSLDADKMRRLGE